MTPTEHPDVNFDEARSELRAGLESSRQMIRQSRELFQLAECDGRAANDNGDDVGAVN